MSVAVEPGQAGASIERAIERLAQFRFAEGLWAREPSLWSPDPSIQQKIAARLGWLDAMDLASADLARLHGVADGVRTGGFTDVVLLGMGGSSLAPEVIRQVLGVSPASPRFRVLDSVNPDAVRDALAHPDASLFILASKSGTTIEPNAMAAEARRRVEEAGHAPWGSRFVAITDEHTALHQRALAEQFRDIFVNPADVGGRYSALSYFGIVPAALMGADLERLLAGARAMADACRNPDPRHNPGLALGAVMAGAAETGRDKLTLLLPPGLASLGLWVEQLVAESTGKDGKGIVPIAGEPPLRGYGSDRVAVIVTLGDEGPDASAVARLRESGAPVATLGVPDPESLGAEFFRWEVATAAAGWLLGINPFDEPNVQQAKDATRMLLDTYASTRRLPAPEPHASRDGMRLTLTGPARERLGGDSPDRVLGLLREGDYIGLLAYASPVALDLAAAFDRFRSRLADRTGCATMFGYGPRYLHSTGQLHKGGPGSGLFIIVMAPPAVDLAVPGEPFSFGVLEAAQALGDFASLDRTGRRALLVQMPAADGALVDRLTDILLE